MEWIIETSSDSKLIKQHKSTNESSSQLENLAISAMSLEYMIYMLGILKARNLYTVIV